MCGVAMTGNCAPVCAYSSRDLRGVVLRIAFSRSHLSKFYDHDYDSGYYVEVGA
jgi:hypothetical protein